MSFGPAGIILIAFLGLMAALIAIFAVTALAGGAPGRISGR